MSFFGSEVSLSHAKIVEVKVTELCPCLSYFRGFMGILKVWLFFENRGDKIYTKAVKWNSSVNFAKPHILSNNFSKKCGYFD